MNSGIGEMWKRKRKKENRNSYEDNTNLIMEMGGHGEEGKRKKTQMERKENNQVDDQ